jgi:hypothetical protein
MRVHHLRVQVNGAGTCGHAVKRRLDVIGLADAEAVPHSLVLRSPRLPVEGVEVEVGVAARDERGIVQR